MSGYQQCRSWSIARFPEPGMLAFVVLLWVGYFAVVLAITVAIAIFGTVTESAWEKATQLPRWFAFGIGIWLTGVYLRLYVAHGRTRREFIWRASVYMVVFATALAALTTLGYLLEMVVYRLAGWPQTLSWDHVFTSAGQVVPILAAYLLTFLVWTVAGALIAASFHRLYWFGLVITVPLGLLLVGTIEVAVGSRYLGPLTFIAIGSATSFSVASVLGVGGFLLGLAATWALVRNMSFCEEGA